MLSDAFSKVGALLGVEPARSDARDEVCVRVLAATLDVVLGCVEAVSVLMDYDEMPDAVWTRMAPAIGIALDAVAIAGMRSETGYIAKNAEPTVFAPRTLALNAALEARVRRQVEPRYARLNGVRLKAIAAAQR